MVDRDEIVRYLNEFLEIKKYEDYGPNGLQVLGSAQVNSIVTGVSASRDLFAAAAEHKANMVLVHHGEFWNDVSQVVDKVRHERLKILFENNISLVAYHLPLDAHGGIGNNALLCKAMGFNIFKLPFAMHNGLPIGMVGTHVGLARDTLVTRLNELLATQARVLPFGPEEIKKAGFVSGGGASALSEAIELGLDAFVTGESKESTYHRAKEAKINLIYANHYNSEKLGIQELGKLVGQKYNIPVEFVDIPCPL